MLEKETKRITEALRLPIIFTLVIWLVHIVKVVFGLRLGIYGVFPRAVDGLRGILFSPLIHGDFPHLISNTVPFFLLAFMMAYFYKRIMILSFTLIYLLTGAAVWVFGREVYHIGASGVVYGMLAFVFWSGIFRRNLKSIILALVVTIAFSGYLAGIVPGQEGISWESHLLGALAGIFVSFLFKGMTEKDEEPKADPWAHELTEGQTFMFEKDIFDKTRVEREQEVKDKWMDF